MYSGEDWVMRPIIEGLCSYESVIEKRVDLADIARMNDALDVREFNYRRLESLK